MTPDIPNTVMEDAIAWFDEFRGVAAVNKRDFAAWLMRSPTHIEAFLSVSALHGGLSAATAKDATWLEELIQNTQSNVLPLVDQGAPRPETQPVADRATTRGGWRRVGLVAMLLVTVTVGYLASQWQGEETLPHYVTTLGEQRAVVLDDGSVMQLNTNSEARVRFSATAREIELLQGEAIFDVEKDPARPFLVHSGDVTVRAIGTRFNVRSQADETVVTVMEGVVSVQQAGKQSIVPAVVDVGATGANIGPDRARETNRAPAIEVVAGEQLAIRRDGAVAELPVVAVDTQRISAWTQRRVVFDNDTLDTVIAEFNRYNRSKLVINDEELRERRITGIFTVDDQDAFTIVLGSMTPIRSIERADGTIEIVSAKP